MSSLSYCDDYVLAYIRVLCFQFEVDTLESTSYIADLV